MQMLFTIMLFTYFNTALLNTQVADSNHLNNSQAAEKPFDSYKTNIASMNEKGRRIKSLLLPAGLITYAFIALENDGLKNLDNSIKEEI